jgi:diketogulonate reductase-like aldo/keto reductase
VTATVLQEDGGLMPTDSAGNIMLSDVDYLATWREMEKCVQMGLTRSIGLSNFNSQQIDRLLANAKVKPVNLQVTVMVLPEMSLPTGSSKVLGAARDLC